jgi:hypothetical protein
MPLASGARLGACEIVGWSSPSNHSRRKALPNPSLHVRRCFFRCLVVAGAIAAAPLIAGLKASTTTSVVPPTATLVPTFPPSQSFGGRAVALAEARRSAAAQNQEFDLLLRSGHVIDPRNSINAVMDVAVTGNKIALVAASIDPREPGRSWTPQAFTSRRG